jgi:hypothetical protein
MATALLKPDYMKLFWGLSTTQNTAKDRNFAPIQANQPQPKLSSVPQPKTKTIERPEK